MTYRPATNRYAVSLKADYLDATAQRLQDVVSTQMESRKRRTHRFFVAQYALYATLSPF